MKTRDILLIGGLAIIGYFIYKSLSGKKEGLAGLQLPSFQLPSFQLPTFQLPSFDLSGLFGAEKRLINDLENWLNTHHGGGGGGGSGGGGSGGGGGYQFIYQNPPSTRFNPPIEPPEPFRQRPLPTAQPPTELFPPPSVRPRPMFGQGPAGYVFTGNGTVIPPSGGGGVIPPSGTFSLPSGSGVLGPPKVTQP